MRRPSTKVSEKYFWQASKVACVCTMRLVLLIRKYDAYYKRYSEKNFCPPSKLKPFTLEPFLSATRLVCVCRCRDQQTCFAITAPELIGALAAAL